MKKYSFLTIIAALVLIAGCKKFDFDTAATGEAIGAFANTIPADNNELMLNSAQPLTTVSFKWTTASMGVNSPVTYSLKLDKKTGDFSAPVWQLKSDNNGTATQLTVTQKSLDSVLNTLSIATAARTQMKWQVIATNATGTTLSTTPTNINITRFGIGITPFTIYAPASSATPVTIDPSSTSNFFNFKWQAATAVPASNAVTYKVAFVVESFDVNGNTVTPNFAQPLFSITSNTAGTALAADISWKQLNDSLIAHGLTDLSQTTKLQWKAIATAGTFSAQSTDFNNLYIIREVKMYLVGSFQGWDPGTGIRMIPDTRSGLLGNMFYQYIYMPANTDFKFLQGTAWGQPDFGDGGSGILVPGGSTNLHITTAGVYRISLNKATLKYDVSTGRMGMVGSSQPAPWDPPTVFPNFSMGFINTNQFLGVRHLLPGGWKLIDNNAWDSGSQLPGETRSYGSAGPSGSDLSVNGPNMPDITTTGDYRVIWDASDVTHPKYMQMPVTEMRIVGNGMTGVAEWDPGSSPAMTYGGNGIWTKTLPLISGKEIKFLAGNAWGAFDYEDAGGGKIKYDGGGNFATPATSGTYTITLNENTGTVTIL